MEKKKTILLTGVNGFLGSHLLEALIGEGHKVIGLKRSSSNLQRIDHLTGRFDAHDVDVEPLSSVFDRNDIDAVIHTATNYGREDQEFSEVLEANVIFGVNLLDHCIRSKVKLFINTDTFANDKRYHTNYMRNYTLSKKQFAEWLTLAGTTLSIVNMKLHHVYGPGDRDDKFVPWFLKCLVENNNIELSAGIQLRDFIYIEDVVSAYISIMERKISEVAGNDYIVATGKKTSVKEFCIITKKIVEKYIGRDAANLQFGNIHFTGEKYDVFNDCSNLVSLGWKPNYTVKSGLEKVVRITLSEKSNEPK